jgi:hypothetical protein
MKRYDKIQQGYENDNSEQEEYLNSFKLGDKIKMNGRVYCFTDCECKDNKSQYDYTKGCFGIIYEIYYQSVTTFFKKKISMKELSQLNI